MVKGVSALLTSEALTINCDVTLIGQHIVGLCAVQMSKMQTFYNEGMKTDE